MCSKYLASLTSRNLRITWILNLAPLVGIIGIIQTHIYLWKEEPIFLLIQSATLVLTTSLFIKPTLQKLLMAFIFSIFSALFHLSFCGSDMKLKDIFSKIFVIPICYSNSIFYCSHSGLKIQYCNILGNSVSNFYIHYHHEAVWN